MASGYENETAFWRAEAERLAGENEILQARALELEAHVAVLSEKVATLAKLVFGERSEKAKAKKPAAGAPSDDANDTGSNVRGRRGQQPGSSGHGRRDYSRLETEEEVHDVPDEERCCPERGEQYTPAVAGAPGPARARQAGSARSGAGGGDAGEAHAGAQVRQADVEQVPVAGVDRSLARLGRPSDRGQVLPEGDLAGQLPGAAQDNQVVDFEAHGLELLEDDGRFHGPHLGAVEGVSDGHVVS
jgi:hypothetical protein